MAMVAAVMVATAVLGACGGGSSKSTSATTTGPTASAGVTSAPQTFQAVNAKVAAAITAVQPKLNPAAPAGQSFTQTETVVRQALAQWQSAVLPQSDDVQAITLALQALQIDFAAATVNRVKVTADIGSYDAAATRYEQAEHVSTSAG
jgi:hypothetical protein